MDLTKPWDSLSSDEKRLFARMAEVYAGFSSYTDHELGRLIDYLEESGEINNTVIVVVSDNGASGEGGPDGSVNENLFFNSMPDDLQQNLRMIDDLGSPKTYNHYPNGWAMAFNTPFKMWKRYSYNGGICDPLIIAWPEGIKAAGRDPAPVPSRHRHRAHRAGLLRHRGAGGHQRLHPVADAGRQHALYLRGARRSDDRDTQYYEMLGTRGIWHQGWKAVTRHPPLLTGATSTRTYGNCTTRT